MDPGRPQRDYERIQETTERTQQNTSVHTAGVAPTTARSQSVRWARRVFSAPAEENTQRTRWRNADPPTAVGHPAAENTSSEAETTERIQQNTRNRGEYRIRNSATDPVVAGGLRGLAPAHRGLQAGHHALRAVRHGP
jgi:hypothetical protein